MEPVLARLTTRRRIRWRWIAGAWFGTMVAWGLRAEAQYDSRGYQTPVVTEADAQHFLSEQGLAGQRCDSKWHEMHILPSATLTFELQGEQPRTVSRDEYLKEFRAHCRYWWGLPSPDRTGFSIQRQQYGPAIVKFTWSGREAEQLFFFEGRAFDDAEVTLSLVHDGTSVKIQDWWVVGTPRSEKRP